MKHPKYKGVNTIEAEIQRLKMNLINKEAELDWAINYLKDSDPRVDDVPKLRKILKSKERQVIKARRQLNSKLSQKERKQKERRGRRLGGHAEKKKKLAISKALTEEIKSQEVILSQLKGVSISFSPKSEESEAKSSDLFISHASEDKAEFVKPLADELISHGVTVWYDEYSLRIGDSLRRSIDKGLAESRYGLIILSKSFFEKNWTQYELNGLVVKEMEGQKVILPVWHNITKDEILRLSPSLVDKFALNSASFSVKEIAEKVADAVLNP